jgi:hypothetical protein
MDLGLMANQGHKTSIPNKLIFKISKQFKQRNSAAFRIQRRNLNPLQATTEDRSSFFWATALPRPSYANLLLFTIRG